MSCGFSKSKGAIERMRVRGSIKWQLLSSTLILIGLLSASLVWVGADTVEEQSAVELGARENSIRDGLKARGRGLRAMLLPQVENYLAANERTMMYEQLSRAVSTNDEVGYIILTERNGLASVFKGEGEPQHRVSLDASKTQLSELNLNDEWERFFERDGQQVLEFGCPVKIGDGEFGILRFGLSLDGMLKEIAEATSRFEVQRQTMARKQIVSALVLVLIAAGWMLVIATRMTQPINQLKGAMLNYGEHRDASEVEKSIPIDREDELGQLARSFLQMIGDLTEAQWSLELMNRNLERKVDERTEELREAMTNLQQQQEQLVQAEKLASLGGMVAGVAHEINTPIGVSLTAATHILPKAEELKAQIRANALSKKSLITFIRDSSEGLGIIQSNLERASDLIRSFKQVAVDQTSLEIRTIMLHRYLQEVITSLRPELKRCPHSVWLDTIIHDIEIETEPGALAQVITNLVLNATIHAYPDDYDGTGTIMVAINSIPKSVQIMVSDDGNGISKSHLGKIFDPFFTTKGGQGGTGLGLHIVHNIVTSRLGGTIECRSESGKGTDFVITLPC